MQGETEEMQGTSKGMYGAIQRREDKQKGRDEQQN
jgi:hypothetical protein